MQLNNILGNATRWFSATPERALERAYRAAIKIKDIEDRHFNGQKVSARFSDYGESVIAYFQTEVKGYLQTINMALVEFKTSRFFFNLFNLSKNQLENREKLLEEQNRSLAILEKLKFIDEIVSKYKTNFIEKDTKQSLLVDESEDWKNGKGSELVNVRDSLASKKKRNGKPELNLENEDLNSKTRVAKATEKTGVLPRSFLNTISRIRQEIDPQSGETEEEVIKRYRSSRYKTAISIKFILLLIIVPLLTHQLTKTFLVSPLVSNYLEKNPQIIFINRDLEEEAFLELRHFEEMLQFRNIIGLSTLSLEEIQDRVREKAQEISKEFRQKGGNAIANIFADLFSLVAFAVVIATNRKEIEIVKSFLDEIIYGLSDSAKAFLIILFTDMFVGFHSPHGWEVILGSIAEHFGLPENREFNFLFIATFPVILDTIFKYWIFRYLNRVSPSAVATYRNMNE
ncbi:MAG: proton extrusion protein PcxA [Hydrococcus sp. C42_A2020_068]|uniref:proton extrusion protein PcxA n=1 Tax=Pleurocapsa sp. PCC 7327 TaxID=118163 RepID=UPI00029FFF80|nr:proton extrusion protein PcxA [Pleurocapsa sp. PCC 7327]AFY79259.1 CemA family [Pleurocapsa sp. PCC 7327]MBF2019934.1 proton extrusion protein PcxA [Hydrococcus sp. C42_A2020_068]